jgi:hypothetical protein
MKKYRHNQRKRLLKSTQSLDPKRSQNPNPSQILNLLQNLELNRRLSLNQILQSSLSHFPNQNLSQNLS